MPPLVLATRPQPAADALVVRLKGLGYQALAAPTLEIERLSHLSLRDLTESAALALTSAAGARAVEQDLGRNAISGLHMPVFCVGAATAMAAKAAGFDDVISADGDGEALEAEIVAARPRGPVMHLRGEDLAHDLAAGLRAQGVAAEEKLLYRAAPVAALPSPVIAALAENRVDATLFLSARAATVFLGLASPESAGRAIFISDRAAAMWPSFADPETPARTAGAWRGLHTVASRPTLEAVLDTLHRVAPISRPQAR